MERFLPFFDSESIDAARLISTSSFSSPGACFWCLFSCTFRSSTQDNKGPNKGVVHLGYQWRLFDASQYSSRQDGCLPWFENSYDKGVAIHRVMISYKDHIFGNVVLVCKDCPSGHGPMFTLIKSFVALINVQALMNTTLVGYDFSRGPIFRCNQCYTCIGALCKGSGFPTRRNCLHGGLRILCVNDAPSHGKMSYVA